MSSTVLSDHMTINQYELVWNPLAITLFKYDRLSALETQLRHSYQDKGCNLS